MRTRSLAQEAGRLLAAWASVVVLLIAFGYATRTLHYYPRELVLAWALAAYGAQLVVRVAVRKFLHLLRRRGYNLRRALAVGCGAPLERFAQLIERNPWLGIRVEGFVAEPHWLADDSLVRRTGADAREPESGQQKPGIAGGRIRYLGRLADIEPLVERLGISEIYVAMPLERSADAESAVQVLVNVPVNVNWLPDFSVVEMLSTRVDRLDGQPLVLLSDSRIDRHGYLFKRIEDLLLAPLLIVLLAPLLLAIACAVKWTSPGPVLFKQQRHGLGGRRITVWKFRTMFIDPQRDAERQASRDDPRITPVGRWLRRWSLDELPKLFNVVQGTMSLVGPRPHPLWLNDRFARIMEGYMRRHRVKPGLTGWAQVNGYRGETDTWEKMEQRVKLDLYYITHWSPWLDLRILVRTVWIVLRGDNAY
ncbi:MAG: undecaprenyl-phosphate glucose phosphotransferase [Dehalococcoidia bacterium]|nr:undecaprenyl-phosphate glucose phosphotransferase [Dehalococcoidia bacterium]